jgi:hypothetical protein
MWGKTPPRSAAPPRAADQVRDVLIESDSPDCVVRHRNSQTDAESLFEGALTAEEF